MGKTILAKELDTAGIPVYSAGQENRPWGFVSRTDVTFGDRTIVLSARGSIGYPKLPAAWPFVSTQTTIAVTLPTRVMAEYVAHWLRTVDWRASTSGASIPMLTVGQVSTLSLPIPPEQEQRCIVAKLDELLASSRAARAALDAVPALLERYRQAVLAAAFRGDLTAVWRAEHSHVIGGDALFGLLDADLADVRRSRRAPEKTGVIEAELPSLPESWRWTDADRCTRHLTVGHVGPMQTRYAAAGVPFLRSQNVRENRVDRAGLQFIPQTFHYELAKSALSAGDVVIVRSGAPGVAAVIPQDLDGANCADLVISQFSKLVDPELIARFINSQQCRARIFDRQVGVAQQHFNVGAMRTLPIPLMPVDEQKELVRILRAHEAVADGVRTRTDGARRQLTELDGATLAKAFRGELVSQDPTDEPASSLLARLASERAAAPAPRARRVPARA